jgi:hypothetical protein
LLPSLASYKHMEHSKRSVCIPSSYNRVFSDDCRGVWNRPRLFIMYSARAFSLDTSESV